MSATNVIKLWMIGDMLRMTNIFGDLCSSNSSLDIETYDFL